MAKSVFLILCACWLAAAISRADTSEFDDEMADFEAVDAAEEATLLQESSSGEDAASNLAGEGGDTPLQANPNVSVQERPTYVWETVGVLVAVVFVGMLVWGRQSNRARADAWLRTYRDLLQSNFARLSVTSDEGSPFIEEAPDRWLFFATGRRYCRGLLATIELAPRHNLAAWAAGLIGLTSLDDTLTLEVPMNQDDAPPVILAVVPRRRRRVVVKEALDLSALGDVISGNRLPSSLSNAALDVITDSNAALSALLSPDTCAALLGSDPSPKGTQLRLLHITDRAPLARTGVSQLSSCALRLQLSLPTTANMESIRPAMETFLALIDDLAELKLSATETKQLLAKREALEKAQAQAIAQEEAKQAGTANRTRRQRIADEEERIKREFSGEKAEKELKKLRAREQRRQAKKAARK